MSDRSQIEEIKQKLDIVTVGEKYLREMKRSGPNYFTLCPFHNEKTPSFSINQDMQIYKCFGCGESGDVISFIQKLEGVEFPKALEMAADMAGVVLKNDFKPSPGAEKRNVEKKRILEANELAMKYFNWVLLEHRKGKVARDYCNDRKITKKIIKKFQIGVAPEGFNNLKSYLIKKGFKEGELVKWGLLVSKNGKIYDKFRDRLMFPIFNHAGDVVGFSGRQLVKSDYGPKYLNSPETLVYKKKETMYGLFQARDAIRKQNYVVLVEGNVDILSSHRVGVENIVCPLGTALTLEQCKLIKRYADKIYFALDTDEAGEKAMIRGLALAQEAGLEAYALEIGKYQDSDELIMAEPDKWGKVVAKPIEVVEFFMKRFADQFDLDTVKGKKNFIGKMKPFVKGIRDDLERTEYTKRIAANAGVDEDELINEFKGAKSEQLHKSDATQGEETDTKQIPKKLSRKEFLAAVLIQYIDQIELPEDLNKIFDKWFVEFANNLKSGSRFEKLIEKMDEERQKLLTDLQIIPLEKTNESNVRDTFESTVALLLRDSSEKQVKKLRLKIKQLEAQEKDASRQLETLQKLLKKLKKA
ncbi:DNA primase [Candidatus Dojkabacteria bacterium]|nr:DNA primase [Candidatus Dojkabacteria bacterium]